MTRPIRTHDTAPEKRCGKSMLLFLIGKLVPRPLMSSSISPSALFRSIDAWQPTLLIDEVDACLKDNEELRGLINCGHIQEIFEHKKVDRISTAELIKELIADDEKPWNTYNKGFQIKPRQIAAKLKGYGIHSKTIRIGFETAKGYEKEQLAEAFSRYIPVTPLPSVTTSQTAPQAALPVTDNPSRYSCESEQETRKPAPIQGCDVVTDTGPFLASEVIDLTGTAFEVMT